MIILYIIGIFVTFTLLTYIDHKTKRWESDSEILAAVSFIWPICLLMFIISFPFILIDKIIRNYGSYKREIIRKLGEYINQHNSKPLENIYYFLCRIL